MYDKNEIVSYIKDEDLKVKVLRSIDKARVASKNHEIKETEFLNPYEVRHVLAAMNNFRELSSLAFGGYDEAERKKVFIYPDYLDLEKEDMRLGILEITGNFKFNDVSHRNYLGSLLSLGIKREKIGDILIFDNCCQVFLSEDIVDFLLVNLERVGKNKVTVRKIGLDDVRVPEKKYKDVFITVSSNRLDSIVSSICGVPRKEGQNLIKSDMVHVDFEPVGSPSFEVGDKCLISVRKYGRFYIGIMDGTTKKGRIKIHVKKVIN